MYTVLDKDTIEMEIAPLIPKTERGFPPTVPLVEIVNAILYKLKTGVQWDQLPIKALFEENPLSWNTVYYHYRKWCLGNTLRTGWIKFLKGHKAYPDLSSVDLDASHTPAIRGGAEVGHQGRKKRKTANALYSSEGQGVPLAMSGPVSGNHNDLHDIEVQFEVVTETLERADIPVQGLFLNADAGFDSKNFRGSPSKKGIDANVCFNKRNGNTQDRGEYFDQDLYDGRYAVERTNARMDNFRSLLNRFDTTTESWKGFNYLAFFVIALRKFKKKKIIKV